jgi:16S rRNA (adenine1518-N6/adenine1519-N6)-dimethyltransferase
LAQTKREIQALLAEVGGGPRHRFGQNFMIDQNLVRLVAEAGDIAPEDLVLEVGPGTGTLTEELLARARRVVAVEIDHDLSGLLRRRFGEDRRFTLIEGDALAGKHQLNEQLLRVIEAESGAGATRLVANLPYNIASPLVVELLLTGHVRLLAFTVQKEVAERLAAGAGTDAYGPLSVMVQLLAEVELLRTLPPQAFWPAPKVESSLVRLKHHDRLAGRGREMGRFIHGLFAARRKTLRKALAQMGVDLSAAEQLGLDLQQRPERLTAVQFLQLFDALRSAS